MKITEYPTTTNFDSGDYLIKDGSKGTKIIDVENAAKEFLNIIMPADMHRNIYRGKNLGTVLTSAQKTAISNGTFDDLFVGDYWTINDTVYRIADFDYWYNCGDETVFTKHHAIIVPDNAMYNAVMNDENVTTGGYMGSKMYTENLDQAKTKIKKDFGTNLLSHRQVLINAVTDGHPSGYEWVDSEVELMNEIMVYGCRVCAPMPVNLNNHTIDKQQLALFRLNPKMINRRYWYWLRDVASSTGFVGVDNYNAANINASSNSRGVRPVFAIG